MIDDPAFKVLMANAEAIKRGAPDELAVKAANLIIDHLIAVHRNATRKQ